MEMKAEQRISASKEEIWAALNDTEVLKNAMPGCESFEATGENTFIAKLTAKVGPVKAKFKFNVHLTDIDPPNAYTINGEGQGGAAGFARGSASVNLTPDGDDTILAYSVKANVGGKLAQLGSRLIDGAAKKMADEFFGNFIKIVTGDSELDATESGSDADQATDGADGQSPKLAPTLLWVTGLVAVAAALFAVFA